jgi:hypothetical protein
MIMIMIMMITEVTTILIYEARNGSQTLDLTYHDTTPSTKALTQKKYEVSLDPEGNQGIKEGRKEEGNEFKKRWSVLRDLDDAKSQSGS